jgi:hypothetical protein
MAGAESMDHLRTRGERVIIVNVNIEEGESLLFATSPDFPGFMVAEPDMDTLLEQIPGVIRTMFELNGMKVQVERAERASGRDGRTWVAIPAELAARAVAECR